MDMRASEIAEIVEGTLHGPDVRCIGASIDTRTIANGELFVPIVDNRDGHDFIAVAIPAGCAAYLTERGPQGGTAIVVEDTSAALTALGREARRRHGGPVIAITGSVGKTSVKDLTLAAVRHSRRAYASPRSFNNELGVPLTLWNAPADTEVLIVEMGARGLGHITELCEIAQPDIGVVTSVGEVHTSEFGSIDAVAEAKGELVAALPSTGRAVLNIENHFVAAMRDRSAAPVITYGAGGDVSAASVEVDDQLQPSFQLVSYGREYSVTLPVHGAHQVSNALAAIAAAEAIGISPGSAIAGLAQVDLSPWRMELSRTPEGATVINDAYNANAISTEAALRSLAALDVTERIAVLGVMAEIGDGHDDAHQAIAALCAELGISLLAYQESAYGPEPYADFDAVVAGLGELTASHAVLVKGSRVVGLEKLAARLTSYGTGPTD